MRAETILAWILAGIALLTTGMLLALVQVTENDKLAVFVATMGFVYLAIGVGLTVIHGRRMAKRVQAREE